jgi:hypothetical protein
MYAIQISRHAQAAKLRHARFRRRAQTQVTGSIIPGILSEQTEAERLEFPAFRHGFGCISLPVVFMFAACEEI